jgi:hypothetical protein
MIWRSRWLWALPACLVVVALSFGAVGAADKTKVKRATAQVEQGAKQIGRGKVDRGFKAMFKGVHYTVVEGAKFSHNTMREFFKKAFSD